MAGPYAGQGSRSGTLPGWEQERVIETGLFDGMVGVGATGWGPLLVAPFAGSFLGVLVRRLSYVRSIAWVRSRCEYCGAGLRARDLVPLCSWLAARGCC